MPGGAGMAVIEVTEKVAPHYSEHFANDRIFREYIRVFQVLCDTPTDGPKTAREGVSVLIGDSYSYYGENDPLAFCHEITPELVSAEEHQRFWKVFCKYASAENPLDRPPVKRWNFNKCSKAIEKDLDGRTLLNSALCTFDPPKEIDDSRPVYTFIRNEPTFDPTIAIFYQDSINEDPFLIADPGQAKISNISGDEKRENGILFWEVTYEFEFRREGWQTEMLDQGFRELLGFEEAEDDTSATSGVSTSTSDDTTPPCVTNSRKPIYRQILDREGIPSNEPTLLNGHGRQLGEGCDPVYLPFKTSRVVPFWPLLITL